MATLSNTKRAAPLRSTPVTVGIYLFVAIAAFFLWQEHQAHVLGILPYLLLAACPIIHLFMHRGHRGHHHPTDYRDNDGDGERS